MQTTDIWNKLHIHWRKISIFLFFLLVGVPNAFGQERGLILNKSGSDDQLISYGFFLAAHNSTLRTKYSQTFLDPQAPTGNLRAIMPVFSPGFALGFLVTGRLHDQVNVLFTPKVAFYEHRLVVQYFTDDPNIPGAVGIGMVPLLTEETLIEFPLLFKYKSERFNNTRMFFVGGVNGMIRTKNQEEADEDDLVLLGRDLALELGMGFDLYFKFFKFSPEIRFSHGLRNIYRESHTDPRIAGGLTDIRRKTITLYLNFQ